MRDCREWGQECHEMLSVNLICSILMARLDVSSSVFLVVYDENVSVLYIPEMVSLVLKFLAE